VQVRTRRIGDRLGLHLFEYRSDMYLAWETILRPSLRV
jgi:hypothetical protein